MGERGVISSGSRSSRDPRPNPRRPAGRGSAQASRARGGPFYAPKLAARQRRAILLAESPRSRGSPARLRVANTWASAGQTRQTATHSKPGRTLNYLNTEAQRLGRYRTMLGVPMLRGAPSSAGWCKRSSWRRLPRPSRKRPRRFSSNPNSEPRKRRTFFKGLRWLHGELDPLRGGTVFDGT